MMICRRILSVVIVAIVVVPNLSGSRAQWVPTSGPTGANVTTFIATGTNLIASTIPSSVFRSTDLGLHWEVDQDPLFEYSTIGSFTLTDSIIFVSLNPSGTARSTDGGSHWTPDEETGLIGDPHCFVVYETKLLGGTDFGVYRSTDSGSTWRASNTGLENGGRVYAFATIGNAILAATTTGAIFRSTNSGTSWISIDTGLPVISSFFLKGSRLFATLSKGMILSTDSGVSWSLADSGLPATNIENLVVLGNDLFAATYKSGLFRSTNNGGNWEPVITGFAAGVSIVTVSVTGANLFVAGQPYGVLLSTDSGASWWPMNKGFPITNVNALASIGANVSVGTSGGGFHSSDAGTNWQPSSLADKVNMFWSNDNTLYAGTDASLQFSTDSGKTWRGAGLDAGVRSITFAGQNLVIGTNAGVQISNDTGFTWGSVGNILSDTAVNALLTLDTVIFAGIDGTVFRSTDLGVGWTPSGNGLQGSNVKALVAMSNGPAEIIFAGTFGRGVFVSNDSGRSWSSANVGLTDDSVYTLLVDGPYLFAGTTGGVYLLVPDGKGWSPESSGLTNLDVRALAYDNSYLYAGTTGNGVWRRPLSEMISQSVKSQAASFKHDIVSYPNPFTQSTKISFISDGGYASVSIVNLLGQEVAQLSSGELPRGEHSFTWNSTGLPAGTYTCVVRSSGGVERLPLMLIR